MRVTVIANIWIPRTLKAYARGCVRKLNRMVSAIYDRGLTSAGLKTSQFSALVSVVNRRDC
jgi:hypothetical protein